MLVGYNSDGLNSTVYQSMAIQINCAVVGIVVRLIVTLVSH